MEKTALPRIYPPLVFAAALLATAAAGCSSAGSGVTARSPAFSSAPATESPTWTVTRTTVPSRTPTRSATPTATKKWPLTIVFYGDSLLKVGEVGRPGKWSFSFVDNLRERLDPGYNLVTANYGGESAKWASENLEAAVLSFGPDSVTLWWGINDLLGCPGFFDRDTNALLPENLDWLVRRHAEYLRKQVDALLQENLPVMVVTAIPVDGWLPWTHFDEDNRLIWEKDHWCDYNRGLERLAEAQRELVEEYASAGKSVILVDAWRIYLEHPDTDWMYLDVMHPGSVGAGLIAEEWLRAFERTGLPVRLRET